MESAEEVRSVSLECIECGRTSDGNERGWTARLTVDDEAVVYSPDATSGSSATD